MSVQSEIDRIITAVGNAYSKVSEKGGTVPTSQTVANLATSIDSIPSGGAKETWVIKSNAAGEFATTQIAFTSNGQKFTSIGTNNDSGTFVILYYDNNEVAGYDPGFGGVYEFDNEAYRKLTFDTPPTGDLLTWLQSNAVKQPDDTAVQDTKALTITSNGTVSVTPDAPYDGLSSVDVTVNVSGGGGGGAGFKVTFPATATNWNFAANADLLLSDGTVKSFSSYSEVSGKTIENVVGIHCIGESSFYILQMTLSEGSLAQCTIGSPQSVTYLITTSNKTTMAFYGYGRTTFWWPLADTVISAIEMYNTD